MRRARLQRETITLIPGNHIFVEPGIHAKKAALRQLHHPLDRVSNDAPLLTSAQTEFLEQRVKHNEAHPDEVYSTEQVMERLADLKRRRAVRLARA